MMRAIVPRMKNPAQMSSDRRACDADWRIIADIRSGVRAMRTQAYLPPYRDEPAEQYALRLRHARWTPVYAEISDDLASRPFSRELSLRATGDAELPPWASAVLEDADGAGHHLHVLGARIFADALDYGLSWIWVEGPALADATLADILGGTARPYLQHVRPLDVVAVYSDSVDGLEIITHARILERGMVVTDAGDETSVERVRVMHREPLADGTYGPASWRLYERDGVEWRVIEEGVISIGVIPLVPVVFGSRDPMRWAVRPPLIDIAQLQLEHFAAENDLRHARQMTAYPMLAGQGIEPPIGPDGAPARLAVGPGRVLYAPPGPDGQHGQWTILEPSTASLQFLAAEVERIEAQMRRLGRVPLTAGTAGISAIAAAYASAQASSAIQAWALRFRDALEQAMVVAAMYMGAPEQAPHVVVHTDYAITPGQDAHPDVLLRMHQAGVLSTATLWAEMRRRGVLGPDFEAADEAARLAEPATNTDDLDGVIEL